ncbi:ArnT family glycosyltransferase [Leptospira sp. GIMC2001]|uniref:ArnT family glycosyltransferase n=1 Tax=Leptospira sp. GIMC2001 TaxID=1513297 RepID=UPI002348F933|nr:phospholipid carrier-dependent glycosyltransferase [Leptospira sp. GIMC2001]WCL47571.1 glycosyltransferase family 39 protein [Leptospira sp. GIMC2001]
MHIKTIRESLENSSFLHPILSGYANPYKPPLLFWTGMITDSIFGVGFLGERLPSVLLGILIVLLFFRVLIYWNIPKSQAFIASLIYLTSLGLFKFAKLAMMEIYLLLFILISIYFYTRYLKEGRTFFIVISGLAVGVGALLKGPIITVYLIIAIATHWGLSRFRIRKGKPVMILSGSKYRMLAGMSIKQFLLIWIPMAALPLFSWLLAIVLFTDQGMMFVKFFLGTENLGKFFAENQSEGRIFLGMLGYTLPWTVVFLIGGWKVLTQSERNRKQFLAKWLVLAAVFILILHLLPNRKDPYYTLPSIVMIFLGLSLGLNFKSIQILLRNKYHLVFQIILSTFLLIAGNYFDSEGKYFLILPFLFVTYGILNYIISKNHKMLMVLSGTIAPVLTLLFFQTFLLPALPDRLPTIDKDKYHSLCVLSVNPWDAWELSIYNPNINIYHISTMDGKCPSSDLPIAVMSEVEEIPDGYLTVDVWRVWSGDLPKEWSRLPAYDDPIFYRSISVYLRITQGRINP